MRGRVLLVVFLSALLGGLLVPGVAQAKGPDQATIDGDGMAAPISVGLKGGSGDDLGTLADVAGLWPALFKEKLDPMLPSAPKEDLGPKLVITWNLPDGNPSTPGSVRQELYLYAEGGPLTYTPPGQAVFGDGRTAGGWFRTPTYLQPRWETFGLPDRADLEAAARPVKRDPVPPSEPAPPSDSSDGRVPWPWLVGVAAAALGGIALVASRTTLGRRVRLGSA